MTPPPMAKKVQFLMLRYDPHLLAKKGLHTNVMYIWDSFMTPPLVQERAAEKCYMYLWDHFPRLKYEPLPS
jgi:hypothetical protein